MNRVKVAMTAEQLNGKYFVTARHSESQLDRGLELAESLVVLDADGHYRAGTVEQVDFSIDDTSYRIRLGSRLPEDLATERISGAVLSRDRQSVHDVVDLLGDLRGSVVLSD